MAARDFFEVMKETVNAIAPGLKNIGPQVEAETERLIKLGAAEIAHALFGGSAFTLYGDGQKSQTPWLVQGPPEHGVHDTTPQPEQQQDRGGIEM